MALYDDRNRNSFFPNVTFPQPGMREGQARMNEIANTSTYKSRRAGGGMVASPQGGSMFVPSGQLQGYLDKGYTIPQAPRTAAQQFDINQAYSQGYGAPSPTIQQGAGGPYRVSGGVAAPIASPPNFFQRQVSNLYTGLTTAFPAIAQGLFGGRGGASQYAGQQGSGITPSYPSFVGGGGYARSRPNRYFDY